MRHLFYKKMVFNYPWIHCHEGRNRGRGPRHVLEVKNKSSIHFLIAEFFPRKPNLYLFDQKMNILNVFHPSEKTTYIFA